jgi:hypothetical protein
MGVTCFNICNVVNPIKNTGYLHSSQKNFCMKKMMLILVCLVGFTQVSFSQTKEEIVAQRAKSVEQAVTGAKMAGLEEKQIAKVKETLETLFKKQDEIRSDSTLTPDDRAKKLKDANGAKDWKLKNTIGDKWEAYIEARKKIAAEAAAAKKP